MKKFLFLCVLLLVNSQKFYAKEINLSEYYEKSLNVTPVCYYLGLFCDIKKKTDGPR